LTLAAISAGILLLLSLWKKVNWIVYILPVLIGSFLFRPTFLNLFVGQIDGFLFFFFAFSLFLFSKNKNIWGCAVLSLVMLKPNLGMPLVALFALHLLFRKNWKELIALLAAPIAILLVPLFFDLHWMRNYFYVLLHKSADNNLFPNLHGLAGILTGGSSTWTIIVWVILSLLLLGFLLTFYQKRSSQMDHLTVALFACLASVLVTPYLRAYDLIFLLSPILFITGNYAAGSGSFLKINMVFLAWSLLSLAFLFLAVSLNQDIYSVFLSILVLLILILQLNTRRRALTIQPS
jgi:hypothetical protein